MVMMGCTGHHHDNVSLVRYTDNEGVDRLSQAPDGCAQTTKHSDDKWWSVTFPYDARTDYHIILQDQVP